MRLLNLIKGDVILKTAEICSVIAMENFSRCYRKLTEK